MSDLADLFPGFASEWIDTSNGRIFARIGGKGPPLMLMHGFTQTHVMWHRVAPKLASRFTLVIADLPGYGWSDIPKSDDNNIPYTKRVMARTITWCYRTSSMSYGRFSLDCSSRTPWAYPRSFDEEWTPMSSG